MVELDVLKFAEAITFGVIDGIVAYFSTTCHTGLFAFIDAAFRILDYWEIWLPWNLMKFNMSINYLFEATNVVFTYCDVSKIQQELVEYTDYRNWENYIALTARISGVMIWDFWVYLDCIKIGRAAQNGWDVGICAGKITSLMIDTLL